MRLLGVLLAAVAVPAAPGAVFAGPGPQNGTFESGDFSGWVADANWKVVDNSCGYYSGWQARYWAWSGGTGEASMGVLQSKPFVLDKDGVRLLISGWSSVRGSGLPRRWNYVSLNLESGEELDRVYAPDTTAFVPAYLNGSGYRGRRVVVRAVDDADLPTFSMLCIDDVRTAHLPDEYRAPVVGPKMHDTRRYLRLEDGLIAVVIDRRNGSIVRVHDKPSNLDLVLEPRLAGSYRFALPIAGKEPWQTIEANWVFGHEQRLTSARVDAGRVVLSWKGPLRNYLGERFDVDVTMVVEITDGAAVFRLRVDNRSEHAVGETYFPVLGGLQGLGRTRHDLATSELVRPGVATAEERPIVGTGPVLTSSAIFRTFGNMAPFGDQGPEQFYVYPDVLPEPWIAFIEPRSRRAALVGALDPADRPLYARFELKPSGAGTLRDDGNWPRAAELAGTPVGVEVSFVDCRGATPRRPYEAPPVMIRFVDGGGPGARIAWQRHRAAIRVQNSDGPP